MKESFTSSKLQLRYVMIFLFRTSLIEDIHIQIRNRVNHCSMLLYVFEFNFLNITMY